MQNIVDSIVQVYQDAGVSVPDRHILSVGITPHDCEQINVSLEQLYIGGPGDQAEQPMRCDAPRTVGLTVQIVRCIPTPTSRGQAIAPEKMSLSTQELASDYWLLMDGIMAAESVNYLGALVDIGSSEPSGGFQAVQANVVVGVP
jgi:hypothetical protein